MRVHAERPCTVDEERDHGDDHRRARLAEQLLDFDAVDEQVQETLVECEAAALHDAPAHRRQRVADMARERPAAVQQKAVDRADDEADCGGAEVPDTKDLQQHRVDREREHRVRDADDPELDELHEHRRAQPPGRSR